MTYQLKTKSNYRFFLSSKAFFLIFHVLMRHALSISSSFFFTPSTEADRDTLDWSGCKPLDYRKQSTSVSASTYSSKYGQTPKSGGHTTPFSMAGSNHENAFNTMKLKRSKRFATADHSMMRSYSMRGSTTSVATPKRSTFFFSPEMDVGKRNQKYYRSFLFRKKPLTLTKTEGDGN